MMAKIGIEVKNGNTAMKPSLPQSEHSYCGAYHLHGMVIISQYEIKRNTETGVFCYE